MRIRQITSITILLLLAATASNLVWALTPTSSMELPLTQREQAARLWRIASAEVARKLYPLSVETIEPRFYYQRNYRLPWKEATLNQRILLAEKIGEQGRARFAAERGWIKILGFRNRGIHQGPDSVYWDKRSGRLRVLEAKGGTSPLKWTFNSRQGTNLNAIRSARFVLLSSKATLMEKVAAARVIVAAQQGRLDTGVIRTTHVLGTPGSPKLLGGWDHAKVRKEASKIILELIRKKPDALAIFRHAHKEQSFAMLKYWETRRPANIGFARNAYQQSLIAWSKFNNPPLKGNVLPYIRTGASIHRITQSTTQPGILRLSKEGVSKFAGRLILPVILGVEGLQFAIAYHQYGLGRISQRDFYRRTTGPAIVAVFTVGGAIVGGIIGMQGGGITAIPVAYTGANIGAILAIPVHFAADYMLDLYYREFDEHQRLVVNAAVEKCYANSGIKHCPKEPDI